MKNMMKWQQGHVCLLKILSCSGINTLQGKVAQVGNNYDKVETCLKGGSSIYPMRNTELH